MHLLRSDRRGHLGARLRFVRALVAAEGDGRRRHGTDGFRARRSDAAWQRAVTATGASIVQIESDGAKLNLEQLLATLGQRSVMSLIVEGGPTLLASAFEAEVVDEVHAYIAPIVVGPAGLPLFAAGAVFLPELLRDVQIEPLHPDVLVRGYTGRWTS